VWPAEFVANSEDRGLLPCNVESWVGPRQNCCNVLVARSWFHPAGYESHFYVILSNLRPDPLYHLDLFGSIINEYFRLHLGLPPPSSAPGISPLNGQTRFPQRIHEDAGLGNVVAHKPMKTGDLLVNR